MNRAFKAKPRKHFCLPGKVLFVVEKNGVTIAIKKVGTFKCNDCEDNHSRCYCLAA